MDKVEQFIQDCTRNCSNELCSIQDKYGKQIISYHEWLTPDNARIVAEIAKEETIEKACAFLETYPHLFMGVLRSEVIEDFRKAMEE